MIFVPRQVVIEALGDKIASMSFGDNKALCERKKRLCIWWFFFCSSHSNIFDEPTWKKWTKGGKKSETEPNRIIGLTSLSSRPGLTKLRSGAGLMRGVRLLPSGHVKEFIEGSGLVKLDCKYLYCVSLYKARVSMESFQFPKNLHLKRQQPRTFQNSVVTRGSSDNFCVRLDLISLC